MKKIKVMYFVSGLVSGGVEQMLINYITEMDKSRYEFYVVYQHEPVKICENKMLSAGVYKLIRITARSENLFKHLRDTNQVIKSIKPDIIHSNVNLMNFIPNYYGYHNNVKVRISHSHIAEKDKSTVYRVMAFVCKKLIARYSTNFFACGIDAAKYLHYEDSIIINNAIPVNKFMNETEQYEPLVSYSNYIKIGHVGRFSDQKNHKRLIDIFCAFSKIENSALLVLVGEGELLENIKQYVKEKAIDDKVIFLGAITEMSKFFYTIDLFLLPSKYEGFPVVALESQAAGVKSIYSDRVDKKVKITKYIEFMSLDASNEEWALAIQKLLKTPVDDNQYEKLKDSGYVIEEEAKKMERYYECFLGEVKDDI